MEKFLPPYIYIALSVGNVGFSSRVVGVIVSFRVQYMVFSRTHTTTVDMIFQNHPHSIRTCFTDLHTPSFFRHKHREDLSSHGLVRDKQTFISPVVLAIFSSLPL